MPAYKNLPRHNAKISNLPLYRPIDRLFIFLWGKRRLLAPILALILFIALGFSGFKIYASYTDGKASTLLHQKKFQEIVSRYPRSDAALIARMELGHQALKDKKWDGAASLYQEVARRSQKPVQGILHISALHNLAFALMQKMEKGDGDQAVAYLLQAAGDPNNVLSDYSRLLLARAYEKKGEAGKSKELYKSLSETAQTISLQEEAKERLLWQVAQEEK